MTALPTQLAHLCIIQALEKPDVMDWSSHDYDRMIGDLLGRQDRLAKIIADYQVGAGLDDHSAWEDAYGIAEAILASDATRSSFREQIMAAYTQGAMDVHHHYEPDPDPSFTEAASDYAASVGA